jgi:hypothetical protein
MVEVTLACNELSGCSMLYPRRIILCRRLTGLHALVHLSRNSDENQICVDEQYPRGTSCLSFWSSNADHYPRLRVGLIIIVTGVVVSLGFGAFSFCSLGPKGEAGSLGLHVLNHDCSGDKCDLACDAGEKLASVTCPGGTIGLTKTGDTQNGIVHQHFGSNLGDLCSAVISTRDVKLRPIGAIYSGASTSTVTSESTASAPSLAVSRKT